MSTEVFLVLIPALVTLVASLFQGYLKVAEGRVEAKQEKEISDTNVAVQDRARVSPDDRIRGHLGARLSEATAAVARYNRESSVYGLSNGLLVFGQYVVGIALTSSFLKESLTPFWTGMLGLVVLVATVLHQRIKPDSRKRIATAKAKALRSTIRGVQDELALREDPEMERIIKRLTKALDRADSEDSLDEGERAPVSKPDAVETVP